ncbi:chitin deacetylase [Aspergillus affinis]|uniref:chitin deacetylase n=1 Tax=Aspergillus affinis TaxID=1070780 RepID=UPI0022FED841|nr:chitin deacetylase [Aspergillus affinis]KAI9042356.1 chitin deacetylase [Aspergillus affinis]
MSFIYKFAALAFASTVFSYPRPQWTSSVGAGQVITHCTTPNTIALTFDDGPSPYTNQLLDILAEYGAKATFFVLGDAVTSSPDAIVRARREGHQIGSHTYALSYHIYNVYHASCVAIRNAIDSMFNPSNLPSYSHLSLSSLSNEEVAQQMTRLEDTLRPIMGDAPTYMRPPYLEVNNNVLSVLRDLGYKVISSSVDTKDYENNEPSRISLSFDKFVSELNAGGNIVLAHDIHEQTVVTLARKMLEESKRRGLKVTTVGECLGETEAELYRQGR